MSACCKIALKHRPRSADRRATPFATCLQESSVNLPFKPRRSLVPLALPSATSLGMIVCLLLPACSTAAQSPAASEEHAARAEERAVSAEQRASAREAEKAARAQEREAARGQHDAAQSASEPGGEQSPGEPVSTPSQPTTAPKLEHGCRVSIEAISTHVATGATVTLSGSLTCPLSASAAGRQVAIYERQAGGGLGLVAEATTEADGSYDLTSPALSTNAVFQARVGRHRARVAVKVAPEVTLAIVPSSAQASAAAAQSQPRLRARTTFTGTVSPAVDGALVALQVAYAADGGRWQSVAYSRVNAAGEYAIVHAFKAPGQASMRTIVHLGRHYAPAISEALAYEVPQPQSPQLSIDASADPLPYGQSVTIGGVAAGAAGQTVTLFARTGTGAFAEVAKASTGAGGEYTFSEAPLQSTYYRVSDATAKSTTLFDGVSFALTSEPAPSSVQAGQPLALTGTLSPATPGALVYLECEYPSGVGFHVIASGTVGSGTEYTIEHAFAKPGTVVLRVRALGADQLQEGASAPFTVSVTA
jgi:hypothetical protein